MRFHFQEAASGQGKRKRLELPKPGNLDEEPYRVKLGPLRWGTAPLMLGSEFKG